MRGIGKTYEKTLHYWGTYLTSDCYCMSYRRLSLLVIIYYNWTCGRERPLRRSNRTFLLNKNQCMFEIETSCSQSNLQKFLVLLESGLKRFTFLTEINDASIMNDPLTVPEHG